MEILRGEKVFPTGPAEDGEKASGLLEHYHRRSGFTEDRPEFKSDLCHFYLKLSK